jgi:ATP-dependent Clp protease protease subunit
MTLPPFPGEPSLGVPDRLLERRIVLAGGHLDGERASELSARFITLDELGEEPITLHLRTPDGDLTAAFAVADTIGVLACPVRAVVTGQVGGPALAVLAAARRREMTPNATLRLTEPRGQVGGDATDIAAHEAELRRLVDAFYIRLADVTGREVDEIRQDARDGRLLTAEGAIAYGLVHAIAGGP